MAWELVYTSAEKGLAEGTRGFCTVAATRGMPASLAARLEALSGYRPRYGTASPADAVQPVQFSHVRLEFGGRPLHVISRVAYAGTDYSGRINKLAHHVALEPDELIEAGPAAWASAMSDWVTDWSGPPRELEPRDVAFANGDSSASPAGCPGWASAAGDAGYAGLLAERAMLDPSQASHVAYSPGVHEPLGLIDEALRCMPASARWGVTFATYYTDPLPESGAAWRFVVSGTPAADAAAQPSRTDAGLLWLPLGHEMPGLHASRYVEHARGHDQTGGDPADAPGEGAGLETPVASTLPSWFTIGEGRAASIVTPQQSVQTPPIAPGERVSNSLDIQPPGAVRTVPARWFWAAALGWPVLLGLAWLVWWTPSPSPAVQAAFQTPGLSSDPTEAEPDEVEAPRSAWTRPSEGVESRPVEHDPLHAVRPLELDEPVEPPMGLATPAVPSLATPVAASRTETDAGSPKPPSTAVLANLPEPEVSFVELAWPTGAASASGWSGGLSGQRLADWQAAVPSAVRVRVRPADLAASAEHRLGWRQDGPAAVFALTYADALGGLHRSELGRAVVDAGSAELRWVWSDAAAQHASAAAGDELRWSVLEVLDSSGLVWHRVQGATPVRATAYLDVGPTRIGRLPAASDQGGWSWRIDRLPSGWVAQQNGGFSRDRGDRTVRLVGPGDTGLTLRLLHAASGEARVVAAWEEPEALLLRRIAALASGVEADRSWLASMERADRELQARREALPKRPDGEVDESLRYTADASSLFEAYEAAKAEAAGVRGLRFGVEPAELKRSVQARAVELANAQLGLDSREAFGGIEARVVLESSGAVAAELEVRP